MNKLLKVLAALLVLLVLAVVLLPMIFKGKLKEMALEQANAQLEATVSFEEVSLSLIKSFPDFSFGIHGVKVDGKDVFEGVRLLEMGELSMTLDLMSVIKGEQIELKRITLNDVNLDVRVNKDGLANYDIVKAGETAPEESTVTAEATPFKLSLNRYELNNFNLHYTDLQGDVELVIRSLYHEGSGDFSQDIVALKTQTLVDAITARSEGINYLQKASLSADFDMTYHQTDGKVEFGNNNVLLNALGLKFSGWVWPKEEDIEMDLQFDAPQTDFKSVLSMIPAVFLQDFESVQTTGKFNLKGEVKGTYNAVKEELPAIDLQLLVSNASFKYPSLPAGVDNIGINLNVKKSQGGMDALVINLQEAKALVAENPLFARLLLQTPISDPQFDLAVQGRLDLSSLATIVPMEGTVYRGLIQADFKTAGKQSDIDAEQYDKIGAKGEINVSDIHLESDSLPYAIDLKQAQLVITPQKAQLNNLQMRIGQSDMAFQGELNNLIGYALSDQTLQGAFTFNSSLLDLNELSGGATSAEEETVDTASAPLEFIRVPTNLDLLLNAQIDQVVYGHLDLQQLKGAIAIQKGSVKMQKVGMQLLGGSLQADGAYHSQPEKPTVDMDFKLVEVGFKETYDAFEMVRQLAPIMEKTSGNYSTSFSFNSELGPDMMPDLPTVYSKGRLQSKGLTSEPEVMKKVADVLKDPKLKKLDIGALDLEFEIKDGRLGVESFDLQAGNVKATVSGTTGLDQTIDYTMNMDVPTDRISSSQLLASTGLNLPKRVDVAVLIGGTTANPEIKTDLGSLTNNLADDVKAQVQEVVEEKIEEAKEEANAAAQRLIDDAEAQGDRLIAEAKVQSDALRQEAKNQGDALKAEAEKQASKLEKEAKGNFLKEAAAKEAARKIRQEADKQAKNLEAEADKQAKALVEKAEKEKADLVAKARQEAKID